MHSHTPLTIDRKRRELRRGDHVVHLRPKVWELLDHLVRSRHRAVSRGELIERLWPDRAVNDEGLTSLMRELRRALGARGHAEIRTLRGVGYQLTCEPIEIPESEPVTTRAASTAAARLERSRVDEPLIERERELAWLERALRASEAGEGRCIVLSGEPGIGKTRLVDALRLEAQRRDVRVRVASGLPDAALPAYSIWRSLLASSTSESAANSVARSDADLAQRVLDELRRAGARQAQLLVLEDLHWADPDSLRVLEWLARRIQRLPLLLVATLRTPAPRRPAARVGATEVDASAGDAHQRAVDADSDAPIADAWLDAQARLEQRIAALTEDDPDRHLQLTGLSAQGVRALLVRQRAAPPTRTQVLEAHATSGGNPFLVIEIARTEHATARCRASSSVTSPRPRVAASAALEAQLLSHSPECRELLNDAAVLGLEPSSATLARLTPGGPRRVADLLGEAERSGILVPIEDPPHAHRFRHACWREFLLDRLTTIERRRIHLRIARALEADPADSRPTRSALLAFHFGHAAPVGGADEAVEYACAAARHAAEQWAFAQALELHQTALRALELGSGPRHAKHSEIQLALATDLHHLGRDAPERTAREVAQALARAEALARQAGDDASELQAIAVLRQIELEVRPFLLFPPLRDAARARAPAWQERIDAALRLPLPAPGSARAGLLLMSAYAHFLIGARDAMFGRLAEAARSIEALDDPLAARQVWIARWWMLEGPEHTLERRRIACAIRAGERPAAALAARPQDPSPRDLEGERWLLFTRAELGEWEACDATLNRIADDPHLGQRREPTVHYWWAMRATAAGRFDEAERRLAELEAFEGYKVRASLESQRCWLRIHRGDSDALLDQLGPSDLGFAAAPLWALARIRCLMNARRIDEARAALARISASDVLRLHRDRDWLYCLSALAEVIFWLAPEVASSPAAVEARQAPAAGSSRLAAALYDAVAPFEDRIVTGGWILLSLGSAARTLGLLAAASGRLELAERHLRRALRSNRRLGAWTFVAYTELELARVRMRRSPRSARARGLAWIARAESRARDIGLAPALSRAAELRGALGDAPAL